MLVSTAATLSKPAIFLPNFVELKPVVRSNVSNTRLGKEFGCKELVFFGKRGSNVITSAESMTSDGYERAGVLVERQVLADDACEFQLNLAAGGLESSLNHMSKWLMISFFYTVILLRHDTKALWFVLGAHLNGGLAIALKRILKQDRPLSTLKSDHGMPSTHAQSIFFIVFATNSSIIDWLGKNGLATTLAGFLLAMGSYFSWLRVSQKFHTISQVVAGAFLGSMFAILWFWMWESIMFKAFISVTWVRFSVALGGAVVSLGSTLYIFGTWLWKRRLQYTGIINPT